jgi:arylsulfatase A-like enzyme
MMKKWWIWGLFAAVIPVFAAEAVAVDEKPNVVLILIDDLGWQDVKCYDIDEPSPMETPNIDKLAKKGVMFWQGYSPAPVCSPSRAAILTGQHPARNGMTSVSGGNPPHADGPGATHISPYNPSRMPVEKFMLAEAMKANGYVTGHSGKWHISHHHYDYPNPLHHGFDESTHDRGVQGRMQPDRLTGFATTDSQDPYRLDENGFPFDVPQDAALRFIRNNKDKPFFLYYATWLVHAPIVMRSEELLRKYEQKLGVTITEEHREKWNQPGQTNPFYCAMVEQLDYYLGQVFDYLENTEDPRRPGHKLAENTYVIFSSDNGGMEGGGGAVYTDNFPLHRGKISTHEGGVRVPLIITGPGIPAGVQTDVMANGLDFYPTILSLIGAEKPADKILDGCDLTPLLMGDPKDASLVRDSDGRVRDTMMWHFPQMENTSAIRIGDYKLIRRYNGATPPLSLYHLYQTEGGKSVRGDIEEAKDLAAAMPEKTAAMDARLAEMLQETGGRLPYGNPNTSKELPNKEKAPAILKHVQKGSQLGVVYKNNGANVVHADLIYTLNNGREWLKAAGTLKGDDRALLTVPKGTSHYFVNLIDENNFLVVYPEIDGLKVRKDKVPFTELAQFAGYPEPQQGAAIEFGALYRRNMQSEQHVLASFDFEKKDPKLHTTDTGVSILPASGSNGGNCLEMREVKGLERDWMPLLSAKTPVPEKLKSGRFTANMDVMLDADKPGEIRISFKDSARRTDTGGVFIGQSGLKVNGHTVAGIEAGVWYQLEISGRFGADKPKALSVSLTAKDGRTWSANIPCPHHAFERPDSLEIIGLGEPDTAVRLDHLVVRIEK